MEKFNDNRKVNENHQGGIERVKQRSGDMERGHSGKMGETKHSESEFKRGGGSLTPRRG